MATKSARRAERLAAALKANLKRRKEGASKAPQYKDSNTASAPQRGPKEAAKQGQIAPSLLSEPGSSR
jgi:hypothetical protein